MKTFKELSNREKNLSHHNAAKSELPNALKEILLKNIPTEGNVLITEGEQILPYLDEILSRASKTIFYVNFVDNEIYQKVKVFKEYPNFTALHSHTVSLKTELKFDFIFTVPPFGVKGNYKEMGYSSNDFGISRLEALIPNLTPKGKLIAVMMQGITYNLQAKTFRTNTITNFKLVRVASLPSKLFRTTNVKSVLFEITNGKTDNVILDEYVLHENSTFVNVASIQATAQELLNTDSWDITKFQIFDDETMKRYESSACIKRKLGDIAEDIFRGRSDLKYIDETDGAFVVNISDIKDSVVNFDNLKVVSNDRNNKKYELENCDILLTSRGTDVRTAIFGKPNNDMYIASAGLIVIRMKDKDMANYVQIFFESEIGKMLLDSLKNGATIMNIVPAKVKELTIPILPHEKIIDFISRYNKTMVKLNKVKEEAKRMVDTELINLDNFYKNFTKEVLK